MSVKAGIGFSRAPSSKEAGEEAIREACRLVDKPVITFLFTTEGYDQQEVLEAVLSQTATTSLVGACGAGVVTPHGIYKEGVAVLALAGDEISAVTALEEFAETDTREIGRRLGNNLLGKASVRTGTVFVFPDGLADYIGEMLYGLYERLGPDFQYVGGGTGDNLRFMKTYQMTDHGVASSSVAAALVAGCSFGIGIGHGWRSFDAPLIITKAHGRILYELDEQPAFEVYSRRLGGIDPKNFAEAGAKHPLGIPDISGRFLIRDPLKMLEGGAIQLVTDVPRRAVTYLMTAEREDILQTAHNVAKVALQAVRVPRFALVFDCVSRSLFLGNLNDELEVIRETLGSLPFVGFLTFGEVGSYTDVPLFHNKTLAIAVGGE